MNINIEATESWPYGSAKDGGNNMEMNKRKSHLFDSQELLVILGALLFVAAGVMLIINI